MKHVTKATGVNWGLGVLRTFWEAYGMLGRTVYLRKDHCFPLLVELPLVHLFYKLIYDY